MNLTKALLVFLGSVSLCIGIAGIFIPGLPTTPFLLLTAGLYVRSSDRLYERLISDRYVGHYISDYRKRKGMTLKSKIISISVMWVMITVSCTFFLELLPGRILVVMLGLTGTFVMSFVVPTVNKTENIDN